MLKIGRMESQTRDAVRDAIASIVRDVLRRQDVTIADSTSAGEVAGWDSLAHVNIVLGVEKRFCIRFKAAEVARIDNVGTMVDLVLTRAPRGPAA